ncbi:hypothetical protein [Sporomusa rhizae]|uniref:hypothetical protein n=1 Tax=Sporomusa rhizae TaxID=357999 RepID=UPI003529FD29
MDYSAKELEGNPNDLHTLFESKPSIQFVPSTEIEGKINTVISKTVAESYQSGECTIN